MPVTPTTIPLLYKKNLPIQTALFAVTPQSMNEFWKNPKIDSSPNWAKVVLDSIIPNGGAGNPATANYFVSANKTIVDNMAPGIYTGRIVISSLGLMQNKVLDYVDLTLEIQKTIILSVSPTNLGFAYTIGQTVPADKYLSVKSENAWLVTSEGGWLVVSPLNGSQDGQIQVGVDVSGLQPGNYSGKITVDDGVLRTVIVTLTVNGEVTPSNYLFVTPSALVFPEIFEEPPGKQEILKIESSQSFTITDNVNWLNYSATAGPSGITSITVSSASTETLPIGDYPGIISVFTNANVRNISVMLRISQAELKGIQSNGFYYSEDRNELSVTNDQANSEIVLDFLSTATSGMIAPYKKKAPYVENIATVIIGQETVRLLRHNPFLDNLASRLYVPIVPLKMDFSVSDKIIGNSQLTQRATFTNVQFINGRSPKIPDRLTYIPSKITVVANALLSFSFRADEPPGSIEITGDAIASIPAMGLSGHLFTGIVSLSDFTLSPGNVVHLNCGSIQIEVVIKPNEPEHARIVWLNEWQMPEMATFTGFRKSTVDRDNEETIISRDGREYTKVVDVNLPETYEVNTGHIYSRKEAVWLSTILRSKLIYLEVDGVYEEVICTTKKQSLPGTREFLNSQTFSFKKAVK